VRDLAAIGRRRPDGVSEAARARIVETAARLAREKLAPRAARYDRDAANPVDSWRVLHADGILAAAIPTAYGGLGLDMPAYIDVIRTLAQGCASTAMTLHMHSTVMRFIDALGTEAQKRRWFAEVVSGGKLFGSWGSEPAVSPSRGNLANRAKYLATEVSLGVTSRVIQVVGGRGAYRELPLERAFRDVRTSTLMPPTMDRMLEAIGKCALGLTEGMFRINAGPGRA
jgi:alkylation response protein AidB-like acyl-CoA dehydrogenase